MRRPAHKQAEKTGRAKGLTRQRGDVDLRQQIVGHGGVRERCSRRSLLVQLPTAADEHVKRGQRRSGTQP